MGWEGHDECLPAVCGVCCVWGVLLSAGWCAEFGIHTLFCSDINVCLEKRGGGRLRCGCLSRMLLLTVWMHEVESADLAD